MSAIFNKKEPRKVAWSFQVQYLSQVWTLKHVAIYKDLEKLPTQLY